MKFLVIGLGSMGKRRVRNLQALGYTAIAGFDIRADRRNEAAGKYGITVFADVAAALTEFGPDAVVISTSPKHHMLYAWMAEEAGLSCFIEASVVEADRILELAHKVEGKSIVMAPSCTMRYFPGPKAVKALLGAGAIGKTLNVNYHTGQYLPDWHPWENIEDFYVSDRETGGAREIVPFELTWLNDLFGAPIALSCTKDKLGDLNADIDDLYHFVLRYPGNVLANITVEVVSRPHATRELRVLGSEGTIVMSDHEKCVRVSTHQDPEWRINSFAQGTIESGYINPEEPYIAEMSDFVNAVKQRNPGNYPNTLKADYDVLAVLADLENLSEKQA